MTINEQLKDNIVHKMLLDEKKNKLLPNKIHIDNKLQEMVIDTIFMTCSYLQLSNVTSFYTVALFHNVYYSTSIITTDDKQILFVILGCMLISYKLADPAEKIINMNFLIDSFNNTMATKNIDFKIGKNDIWLIEHFEKIIITELNFKLMFITPIHFVDIFILDIYDQHIFSKEIDPIVVIKLLTIMEYYLDFIKYNSSIKCAVAIYCSLLLNNNSIYSVLPFIWDRYFSKITYYFFADIEDLIIHVIKIFKNNMDYIKN